MEKVVIDFTMSSLDSNIKFNSIGELKNQRLIFFDDESNKHYILFEKETIEYYKKGSMDMKFSFNIDCKTTGSYKTNGIEFTFDILTTKLENTSNELVIEYTLFQENEVINENKLIIQYVVTKEE